MKPTIVLVHAFGGPPIDLVMPALARRGTVHALLLSPTTPYNRAIIEAYAQTVTQRLEVPAMHVVDLIASHARGVGADAVLTFSEFLVVAVAKACECLGLQGAGPEAVTARNKLAMRRRWKEAGIPTPAFHAVLSRPELHEAARHFMRPFVLKDAWGAGAIGTQVPYTTERTPPSPTPAASASANTHRRATAPSS